MRDRALATLLEDVARDVEFPETPALAERVRARIESGPLPVATIRLPRTRPRLAGPVLVAACIAALVLGLTLSLSVTARRAVADLLGVVGIRVTFGEEPPATPRPADQIRLGTPVSEAAANERAGFRVKVPGAASGTPTYYFDPAIGASGQVSVVYPQDAATLADVDLLVTEFVASLEADYVKKLTTLGSTVRYVQVRASEGYWIGGEPHYFFYGGRGREFGRESVRLAGKVLLWEEGGITYRIEGAGSLREALALAASLR